MSVHLLIERCYNFFSKERSFKSHSLPGACPTQLGLENERGEALGAGR